MEGCFVSLTAPSLVEHLSPLGVSPVAFAVHEVSQAKACPNGSGGCGSRRPQCDQPTEGMSGGV
jgi:hypothetical protein